MFISGIADEAATDIDGQIAVHQELGWRHIELRCVDKVNLCMADDALFEKTADAITASGLQVSGFGASVANWSRPVTGDFQIDIDELARAIPRMQRLDCPFIRVMSWPNDTDRPLADEAWRDEAVRRLKELARMAEDGGIVMVHENCNGWGGEGPDQTLELLQRVDSPALKLVWDTGNPVGYGQDAFSYYRAVRDHVVYVHIKDYQQDADGGRAVYPGEGEGAVRKTIQDLLSRGYDGGFSIEPHMASKIHLGQHAGDDASERDIYIEYGRRLERLLSEIKQPA